MYIDYVWWYQHEEKVSVTCDPKDYPTTEYIQKYWRAYTNPNVTVSFTFICGL